MMSGSDILFTTIHRSRTVISVPREHTQAVNMGAVYEWQPAPALLPSGYLCTWGGRE
ncbi:unnamed protein product, partial [Staurois parvus]